MEDLVPQGESGTPENVLLFADLKGETLTKSPGSINGESFVLRDLEGCSVFLLDYASEVEVSNVSNSQIFIGPVDGPVIFENVTNCQVAVACRVLKANNCSNIKFGLYSANGPSLSGSTGITFSPWVGAYPGLTAHFAAANLDPSNNQWSKVYDATAATDGPSNFDLVEVSSAAWEVPIEGAGAPENPVPRAASNGTTATSQPASATAAVAQAISGNPFPGDDDDTADVFGGAAGDLNATATEDVLASENGNHPASEVAAANYQMEPPATADARDQLSRRLSQQAQEETQKKAELQAAAAKYLEDYYAQRTRVKEERVKQTRRESEARGNGETGPEGASDWDRVVSMIDFNLTKPNASDLGRFKTVLFACKAKEAGGSS